MTTYYAAQRPRGFANEINLYAFSSKAARDEWVRDHESDGDVNSASMGAYSVTQKEARKIAGAPLDSDQARCFIQTIF